MSTEAADPLAPSTTQVNFHDASQNLLATETGGDVTFTYDIFRFDESFSKHFSESTFGVNIPLVYFGFDFNVHAKAALYAELKIGAGALDINYTLDVNSLRAPGGAAVLTDGRPTDHLTNGQILPFFHDKDVIWDTDYSLFSASMTGNGQNTARSAGIYADFDFGASITNFTIGIDLYIHDFGLSPRTLFKFEPAAITHKELISTPYVLEDGALSGYVNAPSLPASFDPVVLSGDAKLPTMTIEGDSADFAGLGFDIARQIGELFGVELSGAKTIVDGLSYKYTILSVSVNSKLHVGQVITFTPAGVEVDINTSVKSMENGFEDANGQITTGGFAGEHLNGQLGDQFVFTTPAMGSGVMRAAVDYTLHGTLSVSAQIVATAGVNITALGAELHNTILKDFDIGVGPLIDIDIPEGGIPVGGVDVYSNSIQVAIAGTHQEFDFYWDHPVEGNDNANIFSINPMENSPELPPGEGGHDNDFEHNNEAPSGQFTKTVGLGGDDEITGNIYNNPIYGGADNDILYGMEGDDLLLGDQGVDHLYGGIGQDVLFGGAGGDDLIGGEGDDFLYGGGFLEGNAVVGGGADNLFGGNGDDVLGSLGGGDPDQLFGGAGIDRAVINRHSSFYGEVLDMRHPDDVGPTGTHFELSDGTDLYSIERLTYYGGKFEDTIITIGEGNLVDGGDGDDFLHSYGNDAFYGGAGDDIIQFTWRGGGTYFGGEGVDRAVVDAMGQDEGVTVDFKAKLAELVVENGAVQPNLAGNTVAIQFEKVTFLGSTARDIVSGTDSDDILYGAEGDDILTSNLGRDGLYGGTGDDILRSSDYFAPTAYVVQPNGVVKLVSPREDDVIDGGDGHDTAIIDRTSSTANLRLTLNAEGTGTMSDGTQLVSIEAMNFTGGSGKDDIRGAVGDDIIQGRGGRDHLDGGAGSDVVYGGDGDDYIIARAAELVGDYAIGGDGIDDLEVDFSLLSEGVSLDLSEAGVYAMSARACSSWKASNATTLQAPISTTC